MDKLNFEGFVNLLDLATDVMQHGGNFNVSLDPYLSGIEVKPAQSSTNFIPWIIAGGLAVTLLVVTLGD